MSTLSQRMAMDPAAIVWDDAASTQFAAAKPKPGKQGATNQAAPTGNKKPNATGTTASTAAGTATAGDKPATRTQKKRRAADIFKAANRTATNK